MSSRTIMICDVCEKDIGDGETVQVISVIIDRECFDVCTPCANEGHLGTLVKKTLVKKTQKDAGVP